jgi:hypothetical protein
MCRTLLVGAVAYLTIGSTAVVVAGSKEVKIGERFGGDMLLHVNQATYIMQTGNHYRVVGDQYSAATMQVVFIESQFLTGSVHRGVPSSPFAKIAKNEC